MPTADHYQIYYNMIIYHPGAGETYLLGCLLADKHCSTMKSHPPPQEVIKQYNKLIDEIKTVCPDSTITINRIPIRGKNQQTIINIAKINTFFGNRGKRTDRVVCGNFCPDNNRRHKRDLVHFNEEGSDLFARNMLTYLRKFRHRLQKT